MKVKIYEKIGFGIIKFIDSWAPRTIYYMGKNRCTIYALKDFNQFIFWISNSFTFESPKKKKEFVWLFGVKYRSQEINMEIA